MYPVLEIAKYIVKKCIKDKHEITNLQLQRILYCVQRDFLRKLNKPAFPEIIEAWPFGAATPEVYYEFCGAGAMPISLSPEPEEAVIQSIPLNERRLIDSIVESKRLLPVWTLAQEANKNGGAWRKVYNNGEGKNEEIPTELIKSLG